MKGALTMTSREIAELTGKRHDHVLRDIKRMLEDIGEDGDGALKLEVSSYLSEQNKEMPEYRLGHDDTMTLVAGYDVMLRRGATVRDGTSWSGPLPPRRPPRPLSPS